MWDQNPKTAREIVDYITEFDAHIVCLQEVREDVLRALLIQTKYHVVFARGMETEESGLCYLVILSQFEIERHGIIHNRYSQQVSLLRWWKQFTEHLESHFVLLHVGDIRLQIFNMHLPVCAGPQVRLRQFSKIIDTQENGYIPIIVGDFNIYADTIWHQIVGWLFLGHSYEEFFTNERDSFEKVFSTSKLRNIFKGRATYSLAT